MNNFFNLNPCEMKFLNLRSLLLTVCPVGAELADVTVDPCPESMGQLQKVAFQRLKNGATANTIPAGSGAGGIEVKLTWTGLTGASDSTKVVMSPYISQPETEPGAKREYGGGNATVGGVTITLGSEPTKFESLILMSKQITIKQLKTFKNESMGVWLFDEHGRIWCIADDPVTPTTFYPVPIQGYFVGDKKLGGYDDPDSNMVAWEFLSNWSDNLVVVTPSDFSPLTDL